MPGIPGIDHDKLPIGPTGQKTFYVNPCPPKADEEPRINHMGFEVKSWGFPTKYYAELMDQEAMRDAIVDEVFYGSEELYRKNSHWALNDNVMESFFETYLGYNNNKPRGERPYTFVVYGASGYTGELTLNYICKKVDPSIRFAIAGRTKHKVEKVKEKVLTKYPWTGAEIDVMELNLKDPQAVRKMVQSCDVVINIAGPFMLTGAEMLVEACLLFDTDYVDVNGEIPFTHKLLEYHDFAAKNGVFVVPNAAYAGGATDVLATYAVDKMAELKGKRCGKVTGFITGSEDSAAPSGGTLATREAMSKAMKDYGHLMMDPFALGGRIGDGSRPEDQDAMLQKITKADCGMKGWITPFMYSFFETRMVRRSNFLRKALTGRSFGKDFNFHNHLLVPDERRARDWAAAAKSSKKQEEELEKQGRKFKQGEGESAEQREKVWSTNYYIAESTDGKDRIKARLRAGEAYEETGHMAVEVALTIALHRAELKERGVTGGVLTPSIAGGPRLVQRLHDTGMLFDVMG